MWLEDCNNPFSDFDNGGGFFLFLYFPRNKKIMVALSIIPKDAKDIGSYYTFD